MPSQHLIIKGKVQGVFFRASAKEAALKIGVKGWVRNTAEGDVEAVATGTTDQLMEFVEWCKHGPKKAKVTEVLVTDQQEELFEDFEVLR